MSKAWHGIGMERLFELRCELTEECRSCQKLRTHL